MTKFAARSAKKQKAKPTTAVHELSASPTLKKSADWCPIWDSLWNFINDHHSDLSLNLRMAMPCATWKKMSTEKKNERLQTAAVYLAKLDAELASEKAHPAKKSETSHVIDLMSNDDAKTPTAVGKNVMVASTDKKKRKRIEVVVDSESSDDDVVVLKRERK